MVGKMAHMGPGFTPVPGAGLLACALTSVLALGSPVAWAQESNASKFQVAVWASSCMACHGPDGKAEGTGLALHGRSAEDLSGKLLAYKSGKLKATMMHQHTKGYSDDELRQIAQYFASLK